jgi:hypothetical protein
MGRLADRTRGAWVWAAQVPVVHARAFTCVGRGRRAARGAGLVACGLLQIGLTRQADLAPGLDDPAPVCGLRE